MGEGWIAGDAVDLGRSPALDRPLVLPGARRVARASRRRPPDVVVEACRDPSRETRLQGRPLASRDATASSMRGSILSVPSLDVNARSAQATTTSPPRRRNRRRGSASAAGRVSAARGGTAGGSGAGGRGGGWGGGARGG